MIALFLISFLISVISMYVCRKIALHYNIVSRSEAPRYEERKIPYFGGVGFFVSLLLIWASMKLLFKYEWIIFFVSGFLVFIFGLIDDIVELKPLDKLLFQSVAVIVWIAGGFRIEIIYFPLWVNISLTFIWMIVMINAVNLLDILDGLAGLVGIIALGTFLFIAMSFNNMEIVLLNIVFLGIMFGFLVYNIPPARIFMGDAGSQFLGFILGAQAIILSYASENMPFVRVFIPLFVLGVPIIDIIFVMICRVLNKRPVFLKSNDHFVLKLLFAGVPLWGVLLCVCLVALFFSLCSIIILKSGFKIGMYTAAIGFLCAFILSVFVFRKVEFNKKKEVEHDR